MAWVGIDNFDSYSTATNLSGGAGGSGWDSNWVKDGGSVSNTETAPAGGQGGVALKTTGSGQRYSRDVVNTNSGIVSFDFYASSMSPNDFTGVILENASKASFMYGRIGITTSDVWEIYNNSAYIAVSGAISVNTWHTIEYEWDESAQTTKWRARTDGGTWTAWISNAGAQTATVGGLKVDRSASTAMDFWVDNIKVGGAAPAATFVPKVMIL